LTGLKSLDYRGYDSWGLAMLTPKGLEVHKEVGAVPDPKSQKLAKSWAALAHTRWATHGAVTKINAHPHLASDNSFAIVHNGIVENFQLLKQELIAQGHQFVSQTDTEVIARLIENELRSLSKQKASTKQSDQLVIAFRRAFSQLRGRNTVALLSADGQIVAARNGSPLVVGLTKNKDEFYLSSDVLSFAPFVKRMVVLENLQMVVINDGQLRYLSVVDGKSFRPKIEAVNISEQQADLGGHEHYMYKEIIETPLVLDRLIAQDQLQIEKIAKTIKKARNVYTIGSGTAALAASQIAYYLRIHAQVRAVSLVGAEAGSYQELLGKGDVVIAVSQSGETADVLEVLEEAKKRGIKIVSYVNMPGSMMERMSDHFCQSLAGPERCVMSTKVFTSQIAWGYLLAKTMADQAADGRKRLQNTAGLLHDSLSNNKLQKDIKKLANRLKHLSSLYMLGKGQHLAVVGEGMVKIIEGAYVHAHAIPAGDLKHYAITLMEKGVFVLALFGADESLNDTMLAVHEVKARGATTVGIGPNVTQNGTKASQSFDYYLPIPEEKEASAMISVVVMQLLAYYMSVALGNSVDKPRNIAKSVTVK
jgi:glutamine---fructose-6-phosphate transaminase (isomerizing)